MHTVAVPNIASVLEAHQPRGSAINDVAANERSEPSQCQAERWLLPTGKGASICAFSVRFRAAAFHPDAFQAYGIAEPLQIARSVPRRRAEYFYGRLVGRRALSELGLGQFPIPSGAFREPVWPDGVVGSISHNDQTAVAAAARRGEWTAIGLDIETVQASAMCALAREAVNEEEKRLLENSSALWTPPQLLTLVFSAKESFFKAAFAQVGHYFGFEAVAVRRVDVSLQQLHLEIRDDLSPALRRGDEVIVRFSRLDSSTVLTWCAW